VTRFRPCIDLHRGKVKQIIGRTLTDDEANLRTNFVSDLSPAYYAKLYRDDDLSGGHVIMLGSGNDSAAKEALAAYPQGLQIGGGIHPDNAQSFLDAGASHVIATSWMFSPEGRFHLERLREMADRVGREKLVVDLSCRRTESGWRVAKDRWQTLTDLDVNQETLDRLSKLCSEFLIHAADVEGTCHGIDEQLVTQLGAWASIPVTYAGGARSITDLDLVASLSEGRVDVTIGSALDIFGGSLICYADCVRYNHA